MKDWLKQTSTIGGLISLLIAGLHAYQSGGDIITAIIAASSAALLLIRDGKFLAGLCAVAFIGQMSSACASIPIPKNAQISAATSIGCAVFEESGCYDELQNIMPGISDVSCNRVVKTALEISMEAKDIWESDEAGYKAKFNDLLKSVPPEVINVDNWNPLKVDPAKIAGMKNGKCSTLARSFGAKNL